MIKAKGQVKSEQIQDVFEGKKVLYKNYITNICDFELKMEAIEGNVNSIDSVEKVWVNCWWEDEDKEKRHPIEVNIKDVYELMFQVDNVIQNDDRGVHKAMYPVKWTQWGKCFKNKEVDTGKIVLAQITQIEYGLNERAPFIAKMIPFSKKEYSEENMIEFLEDMNNKHKMDIGKPYQEFQEWKNERKRNR